MQQQSLVEYGSRRVIITVTAIICALLEIVDTTIVNVALNDMKEISVLPQMKLVGS